MTDRFLRCQMDNDQYVPIRIIASFPKVKRLTNDYNLVVKVLRGFFLIIRTVVLAFFCPCLFSSVRFFRISGKE